MKTHERYNVAFLMRFLIIEPSNVRSTVKHRGETLVAIVIGLFSESADWWRDGGKVKFARNTKVYFMERMAESTTLANIIWSIANYLQTYTNIILTHYL